MSMQPRPWPQPSPEIVAAVRAMYRRRDLPLAVQIRDQMGEVFPDGQFTAAFGVRGRPGWSPGRLALVTVLQRAEDLTDRQAADAVRLRLDWKYALGMGLDDEGFDASVLSEFRSRVVEHGLEERVLDLLLAALIDKGLVKAGGAQRTDSTHVISAVRDLNRLELAGESVRACVEALAVAAPGWLTGAIDVPGWNERYARRVDSWRLPASQTKRDQLAVAYGVDGFALLAAVYAADAPAWLAELPAVEVLRTVLIQNFVRVTDRQGREVVKRREADDEGLPPASLRLTSPYDLDTRWAAKGDDLFWNGYKVHLTETCDSGAPTPTSEPDAADGPNIITNVATTHAAVPDTSMTAPIHAALAARDLLPGAHYVDSGYPSAALVTDSLRDHGIMLVSPLLADHSPQAQAGHGYDRAAFTIDFDNKQATCPQGQTSTWWSPATQRGTEVVVVKFAATTCTPCPARDQCTSSTSPRIGRQLTVPPREVHQAQLTARAQQNTTDWRTRYATRAGVEGTIRQAIAVTGTRRTRYRGLAKTHLDHVYSAVALNIIRLNAWWNTHPLDRGHTSHLSRLELALAA